MTADEFVKEYEATHREEAAVIDRFFSKMARDTRVDSTHIVNIKKIVYTAEPLYREAFLKYLPHIKMGDYLYGKRPWRNLSPDHYNPYLNIIIMDFMGQKPAVDSRGAYYVFFHEVGHGIDDVSCRLGHLSCRYRENGKTLRSCLISDAEKHFLPELLSDGADETEARLIFKKLFSKKTSGSSVNVLRKKFGCTEYSLKKNSNGRKAVSGKTTIGSLYNLARPEYSSVSDVLGGLTNNEIGGYGYGHRINLKQMKHVHSGWHWKIKNIFFGYWYNIFGLSTGRQNKEFFAEQFGYHMISNKKVLDATQEFFPDACGMFEKIIKKAVDKK